MIRGPRLEEMIQSGEVTWPVKIGLKELQLALIAAHDSGKVQLCFGEQNRAC